MLYYLCEIFNIQYYLLIKYPLSAKQSGNLYFDDSKNAILFICFKMAK